MINKTINGYTIKCPLGEGGMAEVWYAENKIGNPAAVKFLKKKFCEDENVVARFENEAMVMVKLNHTYIRRVYDYDKVDGLPCIVMEYLEGKDLKAILRERGPIGSATAARYWNEIAAALSYTHAKGVIHRDIKPSNIFVTEDDHVKLLDFGIAKVRDSVSGTQTGQKLGTLVYMSPEQITDAKHVDYRTDIYSLAVTFVHLLSGRIPYDTDSSSDFAIMEQIVREPLNMTSVPVEWWEFLTSCLAKKPQERSELIPFNNEVQKEIHSDGSHSFFSAPSDETRVEPSNKLEEEFNVGKDDRIIKVKGIPFKMVYVEGGTFEMGCKYRFFGEESEDESPVHQVELSDFYLAETPVTQALWEAVMENNPSQFTGDNLPVSNVSWNDCQQFIQKMNHLSGMKFRLPTEAEWEYAARGGKHHSKYKYAGSDNISDIARFYDNGIAMSYTVKTKQPNALSLYDMNGNVWQWCEDWYGKYFNSFQTNPKGPTSGFARVIRGGVLQSDCRVTNRHSNAPGNSGNRLGFRLTLSPK